MGQEAAKHCNRCGLDKPKSEWHPSTWTKPGQWCKECYRQWHRNRYTPKHGADDAPRRCMACGVPYRPAKRCPSVYCSRECKDNAKNARVAAALEAGKPVDRRCMHCGDRLPQRMRSDAIFCSRECSSKAHALQRKLRARSGYIGTIRLVPEGLQRCGRCKRDLAEAAFTPCYWGKHGTWCRECFSAYLRGDACPPTPHPPQLCRACGKSYVPKLLRANSLGVCSRQCGELLRKLAGNEAKPGYLRAYICERDRWLCGICKKAVSRERQHPDPLCASLDHIIPVSKGGTSDPANLRLTHLRCNLVRRNRGSWEQPMLIG